MASFIKGMSVAVLALLSFSTPATAAKVGFHALIGLDISGCSVLMPENSLSFSRLSSGAFTGAVTTHQIKPLQIALLCSDSGGAVTPTLTLTGNTPYSGTGDTVFLDGSMNGVGFMIRKSDGSQPSLSEFYNTGEAVANNGAPITLTTLNNSNNYYGEEEFWVGLVGPLDDSVIPGAFSATLVVNVVFQ